MSNFKKSIVNEIIEQSKDIFPEHIVRFRAEFLRPGDIIELKSLAARVKVINIKQAIFGRSEYNIKYITTSGKEYTLYNINCISLVI